MYQKDYLLRYIEQLSKAITKVQNKKQEGDIEGAFDNLKQYYNEAIKLGDDQSLGDFRPESFIQHLSAQFDPRAEEFGKIAELAETEAQLWEAKQDIDKALHRYQIALALISKAETIDQSTFSLDRQQSKQRIQNKIQVLEVEK